MNQKIDFTNCPRVFDRAFNGANGKKIAVAYNGRPYMLKFPPSGNGKPTELSYTNSCISEHIASSIFNMLGIKAQETMLGTFTVNGKDKIVCACLDFTEDGKQFYDFCSIKNTVLDSDSNGSGTELDDILETIEKQQYVDPIVLKEHFWNMFVADALLGNFDRHNGNWGFLYDPHGKIREIAPVYDCGSCLLPQADDKIMQDVLNHEDALNLRIYRFPTSAIKLHGNKINYYDCRASRYLRKNKEPLLHCSVFIELKAKNMDALKELQSEIAMELTRSKISVDRLTLRQKEGFLSVLPVGANQFGAQYERVLPASSVANLYPFNFSGKTDPQGVYIGRDKFGTNILTEQNFNRINLRIGKILVAAEEIF